MCVRVCVMCVCVCVWFGVCVCVCVCETLFLCGFFFVMFLLCADLSVVHMCVCLCVHIWYTYRNIATNDCNLSWQHLQVQTSLHCDFNNLYIIRIIWQYITRVSLRIHTDPNCTVHCRSRPSYAVVCTHTVLRFWLQSTKKTEQTG